MGRQPSGSWARRRITGVTYDAFAAAAAALVWFKDAAGEHGAVGFESLVCDLEPEFVDL